MADATESPTKYSLVVMKKKNRVTKSCEETKTNDNDTGGHSWDLRDSFSNCFPRGSKNAPTRDQVCVSAPGRRESHDLADQISLSSFFLYHLSAFFFFHRPPYVDLRLSIVLLDFFFCVREFRRFLPQRRMELHVIAVCFFN